MSTPRQVQLLQGSKWTSQTQIEGWRHFEVRGLTRVDGGWIAELVASCDANRRVQVKAATLLERDGWSPGWTTLTELRREERRQR